MSGFVIVLGLLIVFKAVKLIGFVSGPRLALRLIMMLFHRLLFQGRLACNMVFGVHSCRRTHQIIQATLVALLHFLRRILVHDLLFNGGSNSVHLRHIGNHFQIRSLIVLESSLVQITN